MVKITSSTVIPYIDGLSQIKDTKYNNSNQIDPVKPLITEFKALKKKYSTELMD